MSPGRTWTRAITASLALAAAVAWLAVALGDPSGPADGLPGQAIGDTSGLPLALQRAFDPSGFRGLGPPGPDDWLANHPEPGQSFAQFSRSGFLRPDVVRRKLYLQPIGAFEPVSSPKLSDLADCAASFFAMPVEVLPGLNPTRAELTRRIHPSTGQAQVLAPDVLVWLKQRLPADAFASLGVTMQDLYPEPSWNFVFGMASIRERTGVFSFVRYDPAFFGRKRGPDFDLTLLRRSCKVLTHEVGHMFGLLHCIHYECGLNGSNHLAESDSRPIHLCPVCLRKLQHALDFDLLERYRALEAFYRRAGLALEADWVRGRIAHIQR